MTLAPPRHPPAATPAAPGRVRGHERDPAARAFAARQALLAEFCRDGRPTVLDLGCGLGADLLALAPRIGVGVGVDAAAGGVQLARLAARTCAAGNLQFGVGTAIAFRVPTPVPARFDLILLRAAMAPGAQPRADLGGVLRAARLRLADNGRLVLFATDDSHPAVLWSRWCAGIRRPAVITPGSLRLLAAGQGLVAQGLHPLPWVPEIPAEPGPPPTPLVRALSALARFCDGGAFALVLRAA
ncbi:class I SAM-dependent methyltransferase [Oleisolibacter albus]|uniref:class I SAM-dependent methyltransferase n=1 Tax=Oleisolibacter albus TaxID=2171757 RepID=UPI000DF2522C|nr:methyltransferase domain-containing protein [Oleisolibacter albus]